MRIKEQMIKMDILLICFFAVGLMTLTIPGVNGQILKYMYALVAPIYAVMRLASKHTLNYKIIFAFSAVLIISMTNFFFAADFQSL